MSQSSECNRYPGGDCFCIEAADASKSGGEGGGLGQLGTLPYEVRGTRFSRNPSKNGTGEKGVLFWVPLGYHCGYHWVPALVGDSNSNDPKTRLKTNKEYCFFISMWHHSMACLSWLICHQELRGTLWGWVCERPGDHCHLHVMTFQ